MIDAVRFSKQNWRNYQGNTRALIVLAKAARIHQFDDLASAFFKHGQDALKCGDNEFASRISLAREAAERGDHAITADMLSGHLELDRDSNELQLLASALIQDIPIRSRAVRFFEDLGPEVKSLTFFQKALGASHIYRGTPQGAVPAFSSVFEKERSIDNLENLINAHFGVGDRDAIAELLQSNDLNTLPGSPLARLNICHLLIEFDEIQNALDMAYQALIDGMDDAEAVMTFLLIVLKATQNNLGRFEDNVVSGVWVRLTSNMGDASEVLLDEATDRPWGNKADASNTFYRKALGLKTGDEFAHVNRATGINETWTVSEVKAQMAASFSSPQHEFWATIPRCHEVC